MKCYLSILAVCSITACLADDVVFSEADFAPCAACHLMDGAGIPGAFPKISGRASTMASLEGGREYLIAVVSSGLMGQITADGTLYFGVMPGQQSALEPLAIANALNYLVVELAGDQDQETSLFTADEVEAVQSVNGKAGPMTAGDMRSKLLQDHGEQWPQ